MAITHSTISIKKPLTSSLNNDSMWEGNYTHLGSDNWGQMMYMWVLAIQQTLPRTEEEKEEDSIPQDRPNQSPVALAFVVRAEGHTLLIWPCCYLLLLMENFMKQSSVLPQTQMSGGQSAAGRQKGKKEGSNTQKMTFTRCRSDQLAEKNTHPQVFQQSI